MEVVDVGSRPANDVLDLLFEGKALKSLLSGHGAACFTLVRPMAAPQFFRELIENSATLDATTRQHVAFVVFYGDRSAVVREGYYGLKRLALKVRLDGLSISGDPNCHSDVVVAPTIPPQHARAHFQMSHDLFSDDMGAFLRTSPDKLNQALLTHHMSRVATRLMELYDIRESTLPCLLFTDGDDPKKYLVVQLDPNKPLVSLYADVLRPLSDQFATLSKYWGHRANFSRKQSTARWAADAVTKLPTEIAEVTAEIEHQGQIIPERIRIKQEKLDRREKAYKERIDESKKAHKEKISELKKARERARQEKLSALPLTNSEQGEVVKELIEELATIARGERQFRSLAQQTLEMARIEKRLFRARQRLAAHMGVELKEDRTGVNLNEESTDVDANEEIDQIRRLRAEIEQLHDCIPSLERKRERLENDLRRETKALEDHLPEKLRREKQAIQRMAKKLEGHGYGPKILDTDQPLAFAAIEVMFRSKLLGIRGPSTPTLEAKPMRILFLAANPVATAHLDLEEELRSLEAELRGVRFRDQIVLTARHAVRPDDLVRYVRSDRPTIVHFSGHGSERGIILRNDEGGYTEVTGTSLRRFFRDRGVRLVVLNACYTKEQARLLPGAVPAVVGTTNSVGDVAARRFTVAFYRALGDGYSVREAFRDGGDAVVLDNREDVFWSDGELDQLLIVPSAN